MLNWIVWNRTVYMYKDEFGIKKAYNDWYAIKRKQTKPLTSFTCQTEWLEIELLFYLTECKQYIFF